MFYKLTISLVLLFLQNSFVIAFNSSKSNESRIEKSRNFYQTDHFRIKYLTPYTYYPSRLKDNFGYLKNTKWLKFGCECYLDELDNYKKYFSTEIVETDSSTSEFNLLLLEFNNNSDFLLDHYEPKHETNQLAENEYDYPDHDREIYTLVYMKNFFIDYTETENEIELNCKATLIYPTGLDDQHSIILNEKFLSSVQLQLKIHEEYSKKKRSVKKSLKTRRYINNIIEVEVKEGPLIFNKNAFESLDTSCKIKLLDFDSTYALDHAISKSFQINQISKNQTKPQISTVGNSASIINQVNFKSILLISFAHFFFLL
ncbi:unnamed protein product [Brachionus calyciflorus]|uniref:Uncharacterized protein n=1 Tax=Brachionus calyciflorus TaxID=104777 RepID=A0A813Q4R3_9BILA|nr:unnamed protein product [Brachionus calyciflorus]